MLTFHIASLLGCYGAGKSLQTVDYPFDRCFFGRPHAAPTRKTMRRTHVTLETSLDQSCEDTRIIGFGSRSRRRFQGRAKRRQISIPENTGKQGVSVLKRSSRWACVKNCGACCYLAHDRRGDLEEYLADSEEVALYKSMIAKDGWCKYYGKEKRACTIYDSRPRFCRVEIETFGEMYGLEPEDMDAFCSSCCREVITNVYGDRSMEMEAFDKVLAALARGERPIPEPDPFDEGSPGGQADDTDKYIRDWGVDTSWKDMDMRAA